MSAPITISDAACEYIRKKIIQENGAGFRLTIKKTGCSGYSYKPIIVPVAIETDLAFEIKDIKIYIDPTWQHLLQGLHVEYTEEEKSGLKQKRLLFSNPNESSRCGCGESFHVE